MLVNVPQEVTTLERRMIVRYAGLLTTRGSRSGRISSAAVANLMMPFLWTSPFSSTYPLGSSNSNYVIRSILVLPFYQILNTVREDNGRRLLLPDIPLSERI